MEREVNIAFDIHFEVTLGGILAKHQKEPREMPKSFQRQQNGPKGLPEETWTHLRRYPALSQGTWGGFGTGEREHLSSLWQGAESKMVSK